MEHFYLLSRFITKFSKFKRNDFCYGSRAYLRYLKPKENAAPLCYPAANQSQLSKPATKLSPPAHALLLQRFFSQDTKPQKLKLMDYEWLVWPGIIKTIKNWIYTGLIIRPYLDPEFSLPEFVEGTKHAVEVVSNYLAEGKMEALASLLTPECLAEVQRHLALLNTTQRHELGISKKDIYFSFPYELGILFDDSKDGEPQQRHVEVTVVHHVLRGHSEMIERGDPIPLNIGVSPEFRDRIFILNYRFIRNYTKGVTDQWTLNVVNHFKPSEFVE